MSIKSYTTDNLPYEKVGNREPVCIADEVPFEIPENWEWVRLGTVIELQSGQDMIPAKYNSIGKGLPYITGASNIENGKVRINRWTEYGKTFAFKGDILLTCKGTVGTMAILKEEQVHIARQIMAIRPLHDIYTPYIQIVLETLVATFKKAAKSMIPGISRQNVLSTLLALPPQSEQIRIVKKVVETLPLIEKYGNSQDALYDLNTSFPEQLKKSILQEAIQGKLVPQAHSDESASILLQRIHTEKQRLIAEGKIKKDKHESIIFRRDNSYYEKLDGIERCIDDEIPFEIPGNWCWTRLHNIVSIFGGKRVPTGQQLVTENTGHVYIRVSDMKDGRVSTEKLRYVTTETFCNISKYIIHAEDVYITVAGTIGKVGKIPFELDGANLTENADRLVFTILNQDWLILELQSPLIQAQIIEATTKVGQPKLAIKRIENLLIALPPLVEQHRIVAKQQELFAKVSLL